MNILAVDTSCQSLLVAVRTDTYYEESCTDSKDFKHSERLMGIVLELLSHASITVNDVDLFACTRGPGSFTGLRIGMSALKGMAFGSKKSLVSVSTLKMWADTVDSTDAVVSVIDAKKQRWYLGAFKDSKRLCDDLDGNPEDLVKALEGENNVVLTGPDAQAFLPVMRSAFPDKNISVSQENSKSVLQSLIDNAVEQLETKGADDIGQGPVYLRKSDAEIALEERNRG